MTGELPRSGNPTMSPILSPRPHFGSTVTSSTWLTTPSPLPHPHLINCLLFPPKLMHHLWRYSREKCEKRKASVCVPLSPDEQLFVACARAPCKSRGLRGENEQIGQSRCRLYIACRGETPFRQPRTGLWTKFRAKNKRKKERRGKLQPRKK